MFAVFNRDNFPIVKVTMNGSPASDEEFDNFLNEWTKLYSEQNNFSFIFYTENVSNPHIKYSVKMANYIKNLRKKDYHYLQKSVILINNNKVKWLLDFIFTIQPPVADVYIIDTNKTSFTIDNIDNIMGDGVIYIEPSKPFLSIL
jgi:hypothetical protein